MNPKSSFHLKALCTLLIVVCDAAYVSEIIAQEQSSPLQLRHGFRMVLFNEQGGEMTWEQFKSYTGRLRWELQTEQKVSTQAHTLFENGRRAGAQGDYTTAIELFDAARQNAPGWLYPIYEMAWSHLLSGDLAQAEKLYHRVNTLAPYGFFNSPQAESCLRLERRGEVARGTYRRLATLEHASRSTALLSVRGILAKSPGYAPAWERLAFFAEDTADIRDAIKKGLAADPDPYTLDMLHFRDAIVTHNEGDTDKAIKMLHRRLRAPELTLAVEAKIKVVLPGLRRALEESAQ